MPQWHSASHTCSAFSKRRRRLICLLAAAADAPEADAGVEGCVLLLPVDRVLVGVVMGAWPVVLVLALGDASPSGELLPTWSDCGKHEPWRDMLGEAAGDGPALAGSGVRGSKLGNSPCTSATSRAYSSHAADGSEVDASAP